MTAVCWRKGCWCMSVHYLPPAGISQEENSPSEDRVHLECSSFLCSGKSKILLYFV